MQVDIPILELYNCTLRKWGDPLSMELLALAYPLPKWNSFLSLPANLATAMAMIDSAVQGLPTPTPGPPRHWRARRPPLSGASPRSAPSWGRAPRCAATSCAASLRRRPPTSSGRTAPPAGLPDRARPERPPGRLPPPGPGTLSPGNGSGPGSRALDPSPGHPGTRPAALSHPLRPRRRRPGGAGVVPRREPGAGAADGSGTNHPA